MDVALSDAAWCSTCMLNTQLQLFGVLPAFQEWAGALLVYTKPFCDSFYGFLSMAVQNVTKVGRFYWNCNAYIWREFPLCVVWGFWGFPSLDLMYPSLQIVVEEQVGKLSMCKMDFLIREGEGPAGVICRVSLGCTQILFSPWDSWSEDWITSGVDDWCHVPVFLSVTFLRKENYLAMSCFVRELQKQSYGWLKASDVTCNLLVGNSLVLGEMKGTKCQPAWNHCVY